MHKYYVGVWRKVFAQLIKDFFCPIFLGMEEHESEVLQVECRMECYLLGEQEKSHWAGTDIVDYGRLWKLIISMKKCDWLKAVQFLVTTCKNKETMQKEGNKMMPQFAGGKHAYLTLSYFV